MTMTTETFLVSEGTTMLDGKPVKAGQSLALSPREAAYHLALGRIEPKPSAPAKRAERPVAQESAKAADADA